MLTKSYMKKKKKISSLINFHILNELEAAVAVECLCWRSHFLQESSRAHRVSEVTKVIKAG